MKEKKFLNILSCFILSLVALPSSVHALEFNSTVPNLNSIEIPATGDNIFAIVIVGGLSIAGVIICGLYLNKKDF